METMRFNKMVAQFLFFLILFLAGMLFIGLEAGNAGYPDRTISLIVPYSPGGGTDLAARALADSMEKHLKQPVVVVNKPGGATTIGGNTVATAKPDGYTLGYFPTPATIPEVFSYFHEAPYSSKDLKPICRVVEPVLIITVKEGSFHNLKDLVEFARKNPGMKVGTHGKSGLGYLVMATIAKAEKVKFTDVPFAGDSNIVPAILGDHVPIGTPSYQTIKSLVEAKKLRALASCVDKRVDFAPEIPPVVELGYKLAFVSYHGLFGPREMPDDLAKKIEELVRKIAEEKDFQTKIRNTQQVVNYEDTASFKKSIERYKVNLTAFFKEEGFIK